MTSRKMVRQFMQHIGAATPETFVAPDLSLTGLRLGLILEELHETCTAMRRGDVVETADGLADLKYVIVGTAVACGLPIDDFFAKPSRAPRKPDPTDAVMLMAFILSHTGELATALFGGSSIHISGILEVLDTAVATEAARLGVPLREVFAEVQRSNMTKATGAKIGTAKYGPGGKGPEYTPPDIAGVLRAAGWQESASGIPEARITMDSLVFARTADLNVQQFAKATEEDAPLMCKTDDDVPPGWVLEPCGDGAKYHFRRSGSSEWSCHFSSRTSALNALQNTAR